MTITSTCEVGNCPDTAYGAEIVMSNKGLGHLSADRLICRFPNGARAPAILDNEGQLISCTVPEVRCSIAAILVCGHRLSSQDWCRAWRREVQGSSRCSRAMWSLAKLRTMNFRGKSKCFLCAAHCRFTGQFLKYSSCRCYQDDSQQPLDGVVSAGPGPGVKAAGLCQPGWLKRCWHWSAASDNHCHLRRRV